MRRAALVLAMAVGTVAMVMGGGLALAATVVGTDRGEELVGTAYRDTIRAKGGEDVVDGLGSPDSLYGGGGPDTLYGRFGDDSIYGNFGADTIYSGPGDDEIFTQDNRPDVIYCGSDSVSRDDFAIIDELDEVHDCEVTKRF